MRTVFRTLQDHQLFLKRSKCVFGQSSVAYLGHVISKEGVAMDKQKVQAVLDWPVPKSARAVCGFLGLAGYYRRFIRDFGVIAAPLTALLKEDCSRPSRRRRSSSCPISIGSSSSSATRRAPGSALFFTRARGLSPSSATPSRRVTPS